MEEEMIFYSQEVHESVALYLTAHACRVQVERQPPDYVFHKVTCPVQSCVRHGGGDQSPIHRYYLSDGAIFFGQTLGKRCEHMARSQATRTTIGRRCIWRRGMVSMDKAQHEQKPDEFSISVTRFEVNLVSNIIYIALNHLELDDYSRKMAQEFMVKLQKSVLGNLYSISKRPMY